MNKITLAILTGLLLLVSPAYADEEEPTTPEDPSCQASCPEGQTKVSFADGLRVACVCSEAATEMQPTPEEISPCEDPNDDGVCG